MTPQLSVLCVTRAEPYAWPFLREMSQLADDLHAQYVIGADGSDAYAELFDSNLLADIHRVDSLGYVESVLEYALVHCHGQYVLRLDDDERVPDAMMEWLFHGYYLTHDHWKFPRAHVWGDGVLMTPHLYPDHQTRLSVRTKAGGRHSIHAGSPYGGGEEAPVYFEHHKFKVKTIAERAAIAAKYDHITPGYGSGGMLPFSLPEVAYAGETVKLVAPGDGRVNWMPEWEVSVVF